MNRLFGITLAMLAVSAVSGCGGSSFPDPVPVSGVVKLNGTPVEGATVTFLTKAGSGRSASGRTNAQGEFSLSTFGTDDGAIPGEYTITIAKAEEDTGSIDIGDDGGEAAGEDYGKMMDNAASSAEDSKAVDTSLPPKYAKADESGLNRSVGADGKNHFEFDLK